MTASFLPTDQPSAMKHLLLTDVVFLNNKEQLTFISLLVESEALTWLPLPLLPPTSLFTSHPASSPSSSLFSPPSSSFPPRSLFLSLSPSLLHSMLVRVSELWDRCFREHETLPLALSFLTNWMLSVPNDQKQEKWVQQRAHVELLAQRAHVELLAQRGHVELLAQRAHIELLPQSCVFYEYIFSSSFYRNNLCYIRVHSSVGLIIIMML